MLEIRGATGPREIPSAITNDETQTFAILEKCQNVMQNAGTSCVCRKCFSGGESRSDSHTIRGEMDTVVTVRISPESLVRPRGMMRLRFFLAVPSSFALWGPPSQCPMGAAFTTAVPFGTSSASAPASSAAVLSPPALHCGLGFGLRLSSGSLARLFFSAACGSVASLRRRPAPLLGVRASAGAFSAASGSTAAGARRGSSAGPAATRTICFTN